MDIKTEAIDISGSGSVNCNGEYRWFVHDQKWVKFDEGKSFAIEPNVAVSEVYDQLQQAQTEESLFRWNSDVIHVWVIRELSQKHIHYAAPMRNRNQIPNFQWICVYGTKPEPTLSVGAHGSEYHEVPEVMMRNTLNPSTNLHKHKNKNKNGRSNLSQQVIMEDEPMQEEQPPQEELEKGNEEDEDISDLESN